MCGEKVDFMKKRIITALLACALFCTAFSGCSNSGKKDDTTANTTANTTAASGDKTDATTTGDDSKPAGDAEAELELTSDNIELVVWESTGGPDEWIQQAGAKFTELHPNITIKYVNVELGDSTTQIATDGPAGAGADLFAAPHDKIGELVAGEHIAAVARPNAMKSQLVDASVTAMTYNDIMYGYPTTIETYALYYNKDLVSEADVPKTWEDMKTWGATFNAANSGKYAFMTAVGSCYYTISFTTLNGNRLFGTSGQDISTSYLNTADAVTGMTLFQSLKEILNVSSADLKTSFCDGAFSAGTAATYISGPWNIASFTEAGINFGVTTLPSLPGETTPAASFSGVRGMYVSNYSTHQTEAAAFAEFLLTEDMQKLRYELTTALPVRSGMTVDNEYANGFLAQLEYAFPMPSNAGMSAFWSAGDSACANIWDGADVKTELDSLETAIMASLQ